MTFRFSQIAAARAFLRDSIRCVGILLSLCLFASFLPAQTIDASRWTSGTVDLSDGWRTQGGDHPEWAQPGLNDSAWQTVNLDELGGAQNGWHWFRLHVTLPRSEEHTSELQSRPHLV